jgi:hypothetical protein
MSAGTGFEDQQWRGEKQLKNVSDIIMHYS